MKSIARASNVESADHLQALLRVPVMTPKRFTPLFSYVRQFLPAAIDVGQNTPHGVTRVTVTRNDGDVFRVRSGVKAHVSLV